LAKPRDRTGVTREPAVEAFERLQLRLLRNSSRGGDRDGVGCLVPVVKVMFACGRDACAASTLDDPVSSAGNEPHGWLYLSLGLGRHSLLVPIGLRTMKSRSWTVTSP
jgi:hypothetical protein